MIMMLSSFWIIINTIFLGTLSHPHNSSARWAGLPQTQGSVAHLPLCSLRRCWRKNPPVLPPRRSRSAPLTSLCNEGYLLQSRQKCVDWSLEVQDDGEGLPSPHKEVPGADGLGVVLLIVFCCLEVTVLDPQGYCGKQKSWRLGKCDNISWDKSRDPGVINELGFKSLAQFTY